MKIKYTNLLFGYWPAVDIWPDFKIPAKFRQRRSELRFRITSPNVRTSRIWNKFCVYLMHHWTCHTIVIAFDICSNHFIRYWMQNRKKNSWLLFFFFFSPALAGRENPIISWYLVYFHDCSFYFFLSRSEVVSFLFYFISILYYFSFRSGYKIMVEGGRFIREKPVYQFGAMLTLFLSLFRIRRARFNRPCRYLVWIRAKRKYEIS